MKKRILSALLAAVMTLSIAACADNSGSGEGTKAPDGTKAADGGNTAKTKINVMTFTDETQGMIEKRFLAANPDIAEKFELVFDLVVDATDYQTKVELALSTGSNPPDLFLADADYARKFAENEKTAALKDIGIEPNRDDYYTYTLDFMTVDGVLKGMSHQATPGAMYYRSDYAKDYLGVNSPEEMQALVSTWDGVVDVAKTLQEKTNGDVTFMTGPDELKRNFLNSRTQPWIVDGKLNIDRATIDDFFKTTQAIVDLDQVKTFENAQWSAPWYTGMKDSVFAFFGCTWYLHYTIKPNSAEGYDPDNEAASEGQGSYGKWGMVNGPAGFFWGGTYWYASTYALENKDKADAVARIIKYFCVDDESMEEYAKTSGDFLSKKSIVEKIKDDAAFNNPFLGGQNHYSAFALSAPTVDVSKNVTKYDATFNNIFDNMIGNVINEGMSIDDAVFKFKVEAKSQLPDLIVEGVSEDDVKAFEDAKED